MPGFLTDYANNKVLDLFLGSAGYTAPATLYFGLSLAAANKWGSYREPSGNGYARAAVGNNLTNFAAAAGGTKSNTAAITFPAPTGAWGAVVSLFIVDAATGGNVLAMADLTTPRTVSGPGPAPTLAPGALYLSHT